MKKSLATGLFIILMATTGAAQTVQKHTINKKFVLGWLLPHVAATWLGAESASCLHHGPNGVLLRHAPCGRSLSYPIYFGLGTLTGVATYKLKQHNDEDRDNGLRIHVYDRWYVWGYAWTGAMVPQSAYLLTRASFCPSGTTCK